MNDLNPAVADAFAQASNALYGRVPDIRLMEFKRVDTVNDMFMLVVARLTQNDSSVRIQLSGTFQTMEGFQSKVGASIDLSVSELTGFKGLNAVDILKKHISDSLEKMWLVAKDELAKSMITKAFAKDFKLPPMVEEKPKLLHYEIGIDAAKAGKDISKVHVIGPDAVVELKPIDQLKDEEVEAEIRYLSTRNNLVGGIGSCGGKGESKEDRRRGDLSALRALDAHLHRVRAQPKDTKSQLLAIHP